MSVQDDAIKILDGIEQIARNQMLVRGVYITDEVVRPDLAEAHTICGGRQACMVGSMWIAAGFIKWEDTHENGILIPELPGVTVNRLPDGKPIVRGDSEEDWYVSKRELAIRTRPDLKLAYDTMNAVCFEHPKAQDRALNPGNAMEQLFESQDYDEFGNERPVLTDDDLFAILETARQRIRAQVVS